jgi:hypothetical protein
METITSITIYWDTQDRSDEGWAYRAGSDAIGSVASGAIDGVDDDDLDGAIREACRLIGVGLTPDQFGREPHVDGGYAVWCEAE